MTEWESYCVCVFAKAKSNVLFLRLFWIMSPTAGCLTLISKPWKTPVPAAAFLIAWLTNTEWDMANLNSDLVAPASFTHHEIKTADQGTFVQLVKPKPIAVVHLLISLQRAGSASLVN